MKKTILSFLTSQMILSGMLFMVTTVTAQNISGIINDYTPVTAIISCGVSVGSATAFSVGDTVLLIQMKGASIDTSNSANFGTLTSYNDAGNYEFNVIQSIIGNTITFVYNILRTYTPSDVVQLIRVPIYNSATITGTLTCQTFDGSTGGVLVFIDNGTTTFNADINLDDKGFRGTPAQTTGWISCSINYIESQSSIEALKGEGIVILAPNYTKGTASPANGGGGGITDNGGGGGANFGAGGLGGKDGWIVNTCGLPAQGGKSLTYSNALNKIFLGAAGGDAQRSEGPGINMGVSGGGMVIIKTNGITGNNNTISSIGLDAANTIQDGGGGGGAGGTVLLDCPTYTNALNVNTSGGKGGDAIVYIVVKCSGGGGGGGGVLWVSTAVVSGNINYTSNGGALGLSLSPAIDALPGSAGGSVSNLVMPFANILCCPLVSLTFITVDENCGQCDGSANVVPSGGSSPYTYQWDANAGNQTTQTATGLCPGPYTVIVADAAGCTVVSTVTVSSVSLLTVTATSDSTNCSTCDGMATASPSGGTSPYAYSWSNGGSTDTITGLCAGSYTVTITDTAGCTAVSTTSVTVFPTPPTADFTYSPVCFGTSSQFIDLSFITSGSITAWDWDFGDSNTSTQQNPSHLFAAAGLYNVSLLVTTNSGCVDSITTVIVVHYVPSANFSSTTVCLNDTTAFNDMSLIGLGSIITWQWDFGDGAGTSILQNPTYVFNTPDTFVVTLIVTSDSGCTDTISATVNNVGGFLNVLTTQADVSCNSLCDGNATANPSGGTSPYIYQWNDPNSQVNATATGLCAGNYQVVLTDSNGCMDSSTVVITQPPVLLLTKDSVDATCGGADGQVSVSITGGTTPYTYQWDDPGLQTTDTATGLPTGTYSVTVTDSNGCIENASITVGDLPGVTALIFLPVTDATCNGGCDGNATGTASGGSPPFTYYWNTTPPQTDLLATGLCAGTWDLIITDADGCKDTVSATIDEPGALTVSISGNPATCPGMCDGDASITITTTPTSNTGPFTYLWDDPLAQNDFSATSLCPGKHVVTFIDSKGCSDTLSYIVGTSSIPPIAAFFPYPVVSTLLNSMVVFTNLSTPDSNSLTSVWDFGDGDTSTVENPTHTYADTGTYPVMLIIFDSAGCSDTVIKYVFIKGEYILFAPNAFTPNGDQYNEYFMPKGMGINGDAFEMYIYNRWGDLTATVKGVFDNDDPTLGWDGRANNGSKIAQQDVYVWLILTRDIYGKRHQYVGHVTLIR